MPYHILFFLMSSSPEPGSSGPNSPSRMLEDSVKRSRKRFLSPTILRGEQAVDRLQEQELSASPSLKRPNMALTAEEFRSYMKGNIERRLGNLESGQTNMEGKLDKLDRSVQANSTRIDNHDSLINSNQRKIEEVRREIDSLKSNTPPPQRMQLEAVSSGATRLLQVPDHEYLKARRSLRMWPIQGATPEQVWKATGDFLHVTLGLPGIGEDRIETISRPEIPSGFGVKEEAIVIFKQVEVRDSVIGASAKLGDKVDKDGRPTAGIRIEIPQGLRGDFSTLQRFGYQLRMRHGRGTRRHIKFDDANRSLFLNVKLPGDISWSRVGLELARKGIQTRERVHSQELEARFDLGTLGADRSRTSSLSSSMDQDPISQWTGRRSESTST